MDQPPRRSLRKTTSSGTPPPQPTPVDDGLALTDDEIRARALRRTTREPERGAVAQVAGTVGDVAVGAAEGLINRLLKLARLPIAIIAGLWVVFNVSGVGGLIFGVILAFGISFALSALTRWLDLRAYRRQVR